VGRAVHRRLPLRVPAGRNRGAIDADDGPDDGGPDDGSPDDGSSDANGHGAIRAGVPDLRTLSLTLS
jgi:hypothetical protein